MCWPIGPTHDHQMPTAFRRLKKTVAIGDAAIFGWYGIFFGYISRRDGDDFGWIAFAVGIAVLVLPLTSFFRSHLNSLATLRAFPAIVLLPNVALLLMFGYLASLHLRDPYLTYNDMNTQMAVLFSGAAVLAAFALIANALAHFMDVRERSS